MADIAFLSPQTEEVILAAHVEVLSRATGGTGVIGGNALSPDGMDIDVDEGRIKVLGIGLDVDPDSDTVGAADPALDRIDLITRDAEGDVVILAGTPAAVEDSKGLGNWHQYTSPTPPESIPAGSVILGSVHVAAGAASLSESDIWEFAGAVPENVELPIVTEIGSPGSNDNVVGEAAIRTAIDLLMPLAYLTTTIGDPGADNKVPSEKAVRTGLTSRIATASIATTIASPGVDTKVPSEQAVREELDLRPLLSLLTTRGDMIRRNDSTWERVPKGDQYTILAMGASDPAWSTLASLLNVIATTRGDLLFRGSGDVTRLAKGALSTVLTMGADDPAWSTLTALLDTLGSTPGMFLKRGAEVWAGAALTVYRFWDAPASSWLPPSANAAELAWDIGTNGSSRVYKFDDTTEEFIVNDLVVPDDILATGTVTIEVRGYALTAVADKYVQWRLYHSAIAAGESWDAAFVTKSSGDKACNSTQDYKDVHQFTETVANLGWVAGDEVRLKLSRIAPSGANLSGDYCVTHVRIKIPTVMT